MPFRPGPCWPLEADSPKGYDFVWTNPAKFVNWKGFGWEGLFLTGIGLSLPSEYLSSWTSYCWDGPISLFTPRKDGQSPRESPGLCVLLAVLTLPWHFSRDRKEQPSSICLRLSFLCFCSKKPVRSMWTPPQYDVILRFHHLSGPPCLHNNLTISSRTPLFWTATSRFRTDARRCCKSERLDGSLYVLGDWVQTSYTDFGYEEASNRGGRPPADLYWLRGKTWLVGRRRARTCEGCGSKSLGILLLKK